MQILKTYRSIVGLVAVLFLAIAGANARQSRTYTRNHSTGFSTNTDGPVRQCSDLNVFFDDRPVAHGEQTLTIPRVAAPVLRAHLQGSFGISAFTGSGADYSVVACKFAAATFDSSSSEHLDSVRVTAQGGEITASAPDDENWLIYLIIQAPAGASLDFATHNGPIDLRDISGKVTASVENGPLSIDHCSGEIDGSAQNGPISVKGSSGRLHLRGQNGPLSVRLDGTRWENGGIDGSTQNGPLSLSVSEGYRSGVIVEADGYSPVSCRAAACGEAKRTWDDRWRRIEIGEQPVVVRLSTRNGPISVDSK
jgi:hypothetical protein